MYSMSSGYIYSLKDQGPPSTDDTATDDNVLPVLITNDDDRVTQIQSIVAWVIGILVGLAMLLSGLF